MPGSRETGLDSRRGLTVGHMEGFSWPTGALSGVGLQNSVPLEISGLCPHLCSSPGLSSLLPA